VRTATISSNLGLLGGKLRRVGGSPVAGGSNAAGCGRTWRDSDVTVAGRQIIVVVSDLHLAEDTRTSPDEHCPSTVFARFVEHLQGQLGVMGTGIRLVVLGDMLDLTRLDARMRPSGVVAASIERLESIAKAHSEVFGALGRFVLAGGELDVVVGNHDLDLAHPALQERFITRLGVRPQDPDARRVTIHRWFLYVPAVVYAEHGHRYHDINAVPVPDGRDVPGIGTPAAVPLATYLESFLRVVRTSGSMRALASDLARLTGSLVERARQQDSIGFAPAVRGNASRLRDAADAGLDGDALTRIDALTARLGGKTALRMGRTILGPPVRLILPYGAAAGLLAYAFRGMSLAGPAVAVASAAALARLVRNRQRLWPPPRSTGYALDAARDLRRTLESVGAAVPFYILGHTHVPAVVDLGGPGERATYLNTGSWDAPDRNGRGYPFVRVTRSETAAPDAVLLWWPLEDPADHPPGWVARDDSTRI
jgi:UDP-2,3-diacylglucosamine pyrophosphatase LpxH